MTFSKNINYTTSNDLLNLTNIFPLCKNHEFFNQVKWNHNNSSQVNHDNLGFSLNRR